ncbi:MAG: MunI family type II restriction endonuclease [Gammaproteobacteria bacterium]|nr:MunI family type II restriction endonuclease [Gammaproteobacteria bacterium]
MGSNELRLRENWQTHSGRLSITAEHDFYSVLSFLLEGISYRLVDKPNDFANIYEDWPLSDKDYEQIYNPDKAYRHGFTPDYSIENLETGKKIYVEVKRQDGWIEGLPRSAGRGNAHERFCKYFTPGLDKILREKSGINKALPFWIVFIGNITRDPCRVREITCWFDEYTDNFFFWRNNDADALCEHFIDRISPLLD